MLKNKKINHADRSRPAGVASGPKGRLRAIRPIGIWPARLAAEARGLLLGALLGLPILAGCGGAHAPCPTPTSEIDRLRQESTRMQTDLDRAVAEERRLRSERDAAALKLGAAQAALDSLLAGGER